MAKRRTSKMSASTLALLALGSGLLAARAPAGQGSDERARAARRGRVLYGLHCQVCHGEEGRGDGPLVEHLKVEPSDLRALGRRPGGYAEEWLSQVIDGREEIRGHGTREMPVWGIGLREPDRMADQEADVEGRIEDLVAYLLSIQDPR